MGRGSSARDVSFVLPSVTVGARETPYRRCQVLSSGWCGPRFSLRGLMDDIPFIFNADVSPWAVRLSLDHTDERACLMGTDRLDGCAFAPEPCPSEWLYREYVEPGPNHADILAAWRESAVAGRRGGAVSFADERAFRALMLSDRLCYIDQTRAPGSERAVYPAVLDLADLERRKAAVQPRDECAARDLALLAPSVRAQNALVNVRTVREIADRIADGESEYPLFAIGPARLPADFYPSFRLTRDSRDASWLLALRVASGDPILAGIGPAGTCRSCRGSGDVFVLMRDCRHEQLRALVERCEAGLRARGLLVP